LKAPRKILVLAAALAGIFALVLPATAAAGLTPPSPASPNAEDTQTAYIVMVGLTLLLALGAIVGLLGAARGGKSEPADHGDRRTRGTSAVQTRIGVGLGALALVIFIFGIVTTESAREVQPTGSSGLATAQKDIEIPDSDNEPLVIEATGQQWLWRYEYPDETFSYYELVVPVDTAVILDLNSVDVMHRWWVPELAGMADAVPGNENHVWFNADEVGTYEGRSTAFSGPAYAQMRTVVRVVEPAEYEAWLADKAAQIEDAEGAVQDQIEEARATESEVAAESETQAADAGAPEAEAASSDESGEEVENAG
jgi:heme/copper-type cytochrome/quinol oxidase subunit 2